MHFNVVSFLTNQFVLMSLTVVLGMLVGRLKIGEFSLGTSGTLFVGIIIGWFVFKVFAIPYMKSDTPPTFAKNIIQHQIINKDFFLLTLIMFIAAVGLRASSNLGNTIRKFGFKLIALGFLLPLTGALTCYLLTLLFKEILGDPYSLTLAGYTISGVFTGALTSSPGLAAALEAVAEHGEKAEGMVGFAYSVGYIPGVLSVILGVSLIPILFKVDVTKERELFNQWLKSHVPGKNPPSSKNFSVLAFSLVCFVGYIIGSFKIHPGKSIHGYSLGLTGGVLLSALIFGYIGRIWIFDFRMDPKTLSAIRDLSLAIFLGIVGLRYGYTTIVSLTNGGLYLVLIAFMAAAISILVGFFTGRKIFKMNWIVLVGGICGSMTSTPGLGAAIDFTKSEEVIIGYGASYPFALMGMVFFTILLNNLSI